MKTIASKSSGRWDVFPKLVNKQIFTLEQNNKNS